MNFAFPNRTEGRFPFAGPAAAMIALAALAVGALAAARAESPAQQQPSAKQIKEDTKRAEQEADHADQAAHEGKTDQALAGYAAAVRSAPGDIRIRQRAAALRAQVVQKIVDEAEAAAVNGDIGAATNKILDALRIDPGNTILAERLAEMKQMAPSYLRRGDPADYQLKGPATLRPLPGKKPINVRGDSKSAYEEIAGMFGIKVAFDPDLTSHNVKLRLDALDFYTAMQLLGAESKTFYRVVNPTLIFVATDSVEKRKEYEQEVEQTFPVNSAVGPEDLTEMMRVI